MDTITYSLSPIRQPVNGIPSATPPYGARAATAAEVESAQREVASWAAQKTWSRAQRAAEWDRLDHEGGRGPIEAVWAELARLWHGRRPLPSVGAITDALRELPRYVPPPTAEEEPDGEDDAVPPEPTLVERLYYMTTLTARDQISGRRVRLIRSAMEAVAPETPTDPGGGGQSTAGAAPEPIIPTRGAAPDGRLATHEIAGMITRTAHFAVDQGRKLYVFEGGAYRPAGETFIKRHVKAILGRSTKPEQWAKKKAEEVLEFITVDAPTLWERPPLDVVNVVNGLLDVDARRLRAHSPAHLSPVQIPVRFNPEARCPAIDRFTLTTFPADAVAIAYEIPAWLMTPDTSLQRAVLLLGDGANGKSSYLCMLTAFLGRRNCSAVSLHKLEADRFSVARLVGRLANVCPDLPGTDLTSTSMFKAITGGDEIQGERKFADAFEFTPFARLVFSANHAPRSADASSAFFRRWQVTPFDHTFRDGVDAIPRRELDAALSNPAELSGLLNKALEVLPALRSRGFSDPASTQAALEEFREISDPLAVWIDHNTVVRSDAFVPQDRLHALYNDDCVRRGRPAVTKQAFGRALIQLRPTVEKRQRTVNGVFTWCYIGLGLLTTEAG